MVLTFLGFLNMTLIDVLDILLVAAIIFLVFKWIRGSSAMSIFIAIIILFIAKIVASALNMKMMTNLMDTVLDVGVLALIVIFQPEIRRFLMTMGNRAKSVGYEKFFTRILGKSDINNLHTTSIHEITEACRMMSQDKVGALIVMPKTDNLQEIAATGDSIDAKISKRLILNLFFKNSPLHDGAVIVSHDRIVAARCTLPITARTDIPAHYGMRHKAAIGISESTDAEVIVVSEETGNVTFFKNGEGTLITNFNELVLKLGSAMEEKKQ